MITLKFKNKPSCWAADEKMIKVDIDPARQKFNVKFRKENNFTSGYKVLNFEEKNCNGNFVEAIDVRFYNTKSTSYCCLWITANAVGVDTRGSGCAGGYGYNRQSAAFEEAINNAGIFNFPSFGGSGDNKFVLESLCKMLKIKKFQIVEIFG